MQNCLGERIKRHKKCRFCRFEWLFCEKISESSSKVFILRSLTFVLLDGYSVIERTRGGFLEKSPKNMVKLLDILDNVLNG